jgi:hypothetical protein
VGFSVDALQLEAQMRDFLRRLSLNRGILGNKYWALPVDYSGCEDWMPVGRGAKTSSHCGRWVGFNVCRRKDLHEGTFLHGEDCTGKVIVSNQHLWCHKSSCPVCFVNGWAVREARNLTARLNVGVVRGFGEVDHFTVSLPRCDWDLPYVVQRERGKAALLDRGVIGGLMIPHIFRMNKERTFLVKGVHFHALGFGGLGVCRDCVNERGDCRGCEGFKGRVVRGFEKDGYLVKCLGERQTVFGTSWYQLHHSSIRISMRRFVAVTWFGVCGCSRLKGTKAVSSMVCPVCLSEMDTKQVYLGKERIVKYVGNSNYRKSFPMVDVDDKGNDLFVGSGEGGEG